MGHARATDVYDCTHERVEDTSGYITKFVVFLYNCKRMAPMSKGSFPTSLKKRTNKLKDRPGKYGVVQFREIV